MIDTMRIDIHDLLGREEVQQDITEIRADICGKTVLVTGIGSIGSELCRQIAQAKPAKLIMFDIYENNVYALEQELKHDHPYLDLVTIVGSVRDERRIEYVFSTYEPDIVYHAAAHKHVPLMECCPNEAIKNNVIGTHKLANIAGEHKTGRFILISTDKAVNPINIMGASKRICEMIIQMCSRTYTDTIFSSVRFGNVLDSNGSVIPLFRNQLSNGGPITVTDPLVSRYFMTISEAVHLVLQAGFFAKSGEIFVLDMGEPVRILDVAENMIRLAGLEPYEDIRIEFIGLRDGEKLHEEMLLEEEGLLETPNKKIFVCKPLLFDDREFLDQLSTLEHASESESTVTREIVQMIIPEYRSDVKQKKDEQP